MQIDVLNIQGSKTGRTVDLPEEIFGIEPNKHVVYLAVKQFLAAQRQGTHKVKTRLEVKGSSKKLHKQKGTGGSRKGNIRNPLYKGGGTIFGPKPHSWDIKVNRKEKDLARVSVLSQKAKDNAVLVVEDLNFEKPSTKTFTGILKALNVDNKKSLFIFPENNTNAQLSSRNIPNAMSILLPDMNTYDLMNADVLIFTEGAAKQISTEEVAEV